MRKQESKAAANSKDTSTSSKQSQISQVNKKGITLGAQHASHGDNSKKQKRNQN